MFDGFSEVNSLKLTCMFLFQFVILNLDVQILFFLLAFLWQSMSVTAFLHAVFRRYFAQNHCYRQFDLFFIFKIFSILDV